MTFPYNPSLPNPPDDPGDDVPGMQINSASISSLVAVDHVGFNVAGGGQHNQVTFNANNVPGSPTSPPVLFTDLPTNHSGAPAYPELFFYSGNATQSANQYVLTGNGSVLLMGGIILKWGSYIIPGAGSSVGVVFASAFPNNLFVINLTGVGLSNGGDFSYTYTGASVNGFTGTRLGSSLFPATYNYIAIGN